MKVFKPYIVPGQPGYEIHEYVWTPPYTFVFVRVVEKNVSDNEIDLRLRDLSEA